MSSSSGDRRGEGSRCKRRRAVTAAAAVVVAVVVASVVLVVGVGAGVVGVVGVGEVAIGDGGHAVHHTAVSTVPGGADHAAAEGAVLRARRALAAGRAATLEAQAAAAAAAQAAAAAFAEAAAAAAAEKVLEQQLTDLERERSAAAGVDVSTLVGAIFDEPKFAALVVTFSRTHAVVLSH